MFFFFFFSSRRRHTRYIGDWSSDVCSSDLSASFCRAFGSEHCKKALAHCRNRMPRSCRRRRSEERRVGKECRSRWSPYHLKKKKKSISKSRMSTSSKSFTNTLQHFICQCVP